MTDEDQRTIAQPQTLKLDAPTLNADALKAIAQAQTINADYNLPIPATC